MRRDLSNLDRDIRGDAMRIFQEAFADGIDCDILQGGMLAGRSTQSILETSTIQNYLLGTRRQLLDGRIFRYCKAGAALEGATLIKGCHNDNKPYEGDRPATAYAIGATAITIPSTSTGNGVANEAKDAYADGFIWFQMDPHMFHRIASNTAKSGTTQILTLANGIQYALPESASGGDTMWITIWPSIYGNVVPPNSGFKSVVCKPLVEVAKDSHFWGQTWGPAFFQAGSGPDGQTSPGKTSGYREVVFQTDGSVVDARKGDGTAYNKQRAGYILSQTTTSDGDQLVMLQLAQ